MRTALSFLAWVRQFLGAARVEDSQPGLFAPSLESPNFSGPKRSSTRPAQRRTKPAHDRKLCDFQMYAFSALHMVPNHRSNVLSICLEIAQPKIKSAVHYFSLQRMQTHPTQVLPEAAGALPQAASPFGREPAQKSFTRSSWRCQYRHWYSRTY